MNEFEYVHDANRDGHKVRKEPHDQNGHHQSSLHVVCTCCSARRVEQLNLLSRLYCPSEAVRHWVSGHPQPSAGAVRLGQKAMPAAPAFSRLCWGDTGLASLTVFRHPA